VSEVVAFGRTADRYRLPAKDKEERGKKTTRGRLVATGVRLLAKLPQRIGLLLPLQRSALEPVAGGHQPNAGRR
jgi:hypothetical protein